MSSDKFDHFCLGEKLHLEFDALKKGSSNGNDWTVPFLNRQSLPMFICDFFLFIMQYIYVGGFKTKTQTVFLKTVSFMPDFREFRATQEALH